MKKYNKFVEKRLKEIESELEYSEESREEILGYSLSCIIEEIVREQIRNLLLDNNLCIESIRRDCFDKVQKYHKTWLSQFDQGPNYDAVRQEWENDLSRYRLRVDKITRDLEEFIRLNDDRFRGKDW